MISQTIEEGVRQLFVEEDDGWLHHARLRDVESAVGRVVGKGRGVFFPLDWGGDSAFSLARLRAAIAEQISTACASRHAAGPHVVEDVGARDIVTAFATDGSGPRAVALHESTRIDAGVFLDVINVLRVVGE